MAQPKLRFKREDGTEFPEWKEYLLQDISSYVAVTGVGNKSAFIGTENMKKGCMGVLFDTYDYSEVKGVKFQTNDILVSNIRPYLKKAWKTDRNGICSTDVLCIRGNSGIDSDFLYTIIANDRFFDYVMQGAKGTKMPRGDKKHIMYMPVAIPDFEEQQKIADFLSTADEVIAQSEAEVQNLEQQKKAAIQKIFSQEVRFRREDGTEYPEWEELTMNDIFTEIIEKDRADLPVLSILQGQGTVYRDGSDRNIMYDKKSTVNYKAMKKGDFIIHLRTFEGGLECATLDGISSPAYKILRTNKLIPEAYKGYFRSKQFINGRLAIAVTGVRDGKNIEMSTFWQIIVPVPCLEEQKKIADFLSAYDEAIVCAKQELDKWKELKKGLLQQMFV